MEMQRTSDVLRELLVRQGMTRVAVGAADTRGMKEAGRSRNGAAPQVNADAPREEIGGHHADVGPSPERQHRPVLRVVSSKCEPTRPQSERLPPLGVGSHLVLVVSN